MVAATSTSKHNHSSDPVTPTANGTVATPFIDPVFDVPPPAKEHAIADALRLLAALAVKAVKATPDTLERLDEKPHCE